MGPPILRVLRPWRLIPPLKRQVLQVPHPNQEALRLGIKVPEGSVEDRQIPSRSSISANNPPPFFTYFYSSAFPLSTGDVLYACGLSLA